MGPLLVHIPRSHGAGHLVLEEGYRMVRFGGAAARLDLDEKLYFWYSKTAHYFNCIYLGGIYDFAHLTYVSCLPCLGAWMTYGRAPSDL